MVAEAMIQRGVSIRHMAKQFGVREGALRYRLRQLAEGERPDGRSRQRTATDGYEEAIHGVLERLEDVRLTGEGRPAQARQVYEILTREYGFTGSYKSVVRHIRRRYGPVALSPNSWDTQREAVRVCSRRNSAGDFIPSAECGATSL